MMANRGAQRLLTPQQLADRCKRVVELRAQGLSFPVIGKRLGMSESHAGKCWNDAKRQEQQSA